MTQNLQAQNWEPALYQRLSQLIEQHRAPLDQTLDKLAYMVFDFDETCIFGDVEANLMFYMMEHLSYLLHPVQMETLLTQDTHDLNQKAPGQTFTFQALIEDILQAYEWLWQHYIRQPEVVQLDEVKRSDSYQAFCAKLLYYYQHLHLIYQMQPGSHVPTYWFAGYSQEAFGELVELMVKQAINQPRQYRTYQTPPTCLGRAGHVSATYLTGLIFTSEIVDLFRVLKENRIIPYIITASPRILVEQVLRFAPYQLAPESRVFGMIPTAVMPHITAQLRADLPLTRQAGKSQVIETYIAPNHGGKGPLAVFGDSMGDYHMLTHFEDTQASVLMNRCLKDDTQQLIACAKAEYGSAQARYFVQGRDTLQGQLRPNVVTLMSEA